MNFIEKVYKYECECEEFDDILIKFIDNNYAVAIFVINCIIRYAS